MNIMLNQQLNQLIAGCPEKPYATIKPHEKNQKGKPVGIDLMSWHGRPASQQALH